MILDYYNLREQPFGVTSDPSYLYLSPTHREALASLCYGIQSGRGFMSLLAEPGMGKTTTLFHLLDQLKGSARTVYFFQTLCRPEDLLRGLLRDLGVVDDTSDVVRMQEQLNHVLLAEAHQGRRVVVVIDEAQNLEDSALELVRMLSNFETTSDKLMQLVLAGQPQLQDKLVSPRLLQLRQRMSIFARLRPFNAEETHLYVEHRLRVAGYNFATPLFTPQAEALIARHSDGIPRNINNICFNALSLGWVLKQKTIEKDAVREVLDDLNLEETRNAGRTLINWGAVRGGRVFQQAFAWRGRLAFFAMLLLPLVWISVGLPSPWATGSHSLPAVNATSQINQTKSTPTSSGPNSTTVAPVSSPEPATRNVSGTPRLISVTTAPRSRQRSLDLVQTTDPATLWVQVRKHNSDAEVKLARMYLEGAGVPQNCAQAEVLLLAASRRGNTHAADLQSDYTAQCR